MKKLFGFLLVVVFMMSLVTVAWADVEKTVIDKVQFEVDKANEKIAELCIKADVKADKKNTDIDKIIAKLRKHTDKIADKTIAYAAKYGVEVICEYEPVEIGGQYVLVDPLRIRRY